MKYSVKDHWEVFCHHSQIISSTTEQSPFLQMSTSSEVVLSGLFFSSLLFLVHVLVCVHMHVYILSRHMS